MVKLIRYYLLNRMLEVRRRINEVTKNKNIFFYRIIKFIKSSPIGQ